MSVKKAKAMRFLAKMFAEQCAFPKMLALMLVEQHESCSTTLLSTQPEPSF